MNKLRMPRLGRKGNAALEFAIVGPLAIMLILGACEIFALNFQQNALDEATELAARMMKTNTGGVRSSVTDLPSFVSQAFCRGQTSMFNLDCSKVVVTLLPVADFKTAVLTPAFTAGNPAAGAVTPGNQGDLMLMRAYYSTGLPWPLNIQYILSSEAYQNE